jgi:hypothetical protein
MLSLKELEESGETIPDEWRGGSKKFYKLSKALAIRGIPVKLSEEWEDSQLSDKLLRRYLVAKMANLRSSPSVKKLYDQKARESCSIS